jgi:hypothetical protein
LRIPLEIQLGYMRGKAGKLIVESPWYSYKAIPSFRDFWPVFNDLCEGNEINRCSSKHMYVTKILTFNRVFNRGSINAHKKCES